METSSDPLIGRVIAGKFAVESLIGAGAMGAVYRARQVTLDKVVAVKVMHSEHGKDPAFAARFQREAKAASRLDHPNSMRVIDYGEEPDGVLYIAMEYLQGRDLFTLIQLEWPFSDARIVDIMSQALAALAVAHDMGVLHRDLKPENVMILRGVDDEGAACDVVKVCDFGIAKLTDAAARQKSVPPPPPGATPVPQKRALTTQGIVVGTPEYMSPEQGKGEPLDARSDIYSMGVMLYQLLAGRVPFEAETAIGVVLKHVTEEPPAPSALNPLASHALEGVCKRAMQKRRDDRYANAREMRADLRAAIGLAPGRTASDPRARFSFTSAETEELARSDVQSAVAAASSPRISLGDARPAQTGVVRGRADSKVTPSGTAALAALAPERPRRSVGIIVLASVAALVLGAGATAYGLRGRGFTLASVAPQPTGTGTAQVTDTARPSPTSAPTAVVTASPEDVAPSPMAIPTTHDTQKKALQLASHLPPTSTAAPPSTVSATATDSVSASPATDTTTTPPPPASTDNAQPQDTTPIAVPMPAPPPFDPGKGRVSWSVAGVSGSTTAGSVRAALARVAGAWTGCYQNGLRRRGSRDEGTVMLSIQTDDSGRITGASAAGIDMPDVIACIRGSVNGVTIPNVDTGEAQATIAISLRVPE